MLSIRSSLKNIFTSIKDLYNKFNSIVDYPISIEHKADNDYWVDTIVTKYKSGRMIVESTIKSVTMTYKANGNGYIDYMTVDVSSYGFVDVSQAIVSMAYNNTPKGEHLLYCTLNSSRGIIAWVGALSAGSHTITNARVRVEQRWKSVGGGHKLFKFNTSLFKQKGGIRCLV